MMPDEPLRRANAQLSAAFMGTPQVLHDPSKHRTGNSTTVMLRSTYLDLEHIVGDDSDHSPRPGDPLRTADAAQLADAFRCYSGDLYRVARRRLGDNALAEEAVQETFLRAWRAINRFDPNIGSWRMWLFAICRNAVIDVARRRTRDARTDRATGDSEGVSDGELERVLARWETEEALRQMTASQRQAVTEVHLRGRPYAAVAADLGVPIGTIKSRVHQGLQSARQTAGV